MLLAATHQTVRKREIKSCSIANLSHDYDNFYLQTDSFFGL